MIDALAYPAEKLLSWLVGTVGSGWLALVLLGIFQHLLCHEWRRALAIDERKTLELVKAVDESAGIHASDSERKPMPSGGSCLALFMPWLGVLCWSCLQLSIFMFFWPWESNLQDSAILSDLLIHPDGLLDAWGIAPDVGIRFANAVPLVELVWYGLFLVRPGSWKVRLSDQAGKKPQLTFWDRILWAGGWWGRFAMICVAYSFPLGFWVIRYAGWTTWIVAHRLHPLPK
jgi:hypothetical protein